MRKPSISLSVFQVLYWFAPILIIMGLTAGVVSGSWGWVPLALMLGGLAIAIGWIAAETRGGFWKRRSTRVGTDALVATITVLVILGLINFLGVRYSKQFDLTENRLFSLAPQSEQVLTELKQPIKVWVFDATKNPSDQQLLDSYQRKSEQFTYEYVDPQADPITTREFGIQQVGEVYLEYGGDRHYVQTINDQERLSERSLTNAIAQFETPVTPKVYFVQGHGERSLEANAGDQGGLSQAVSELTNENYLVEPLNLAADNVPDDASVVILAGPQQPLLDAEEKALEEYLKRRSGLFLLLDPTTTPGLDDLLAEWGVQLIPNALILDPSGQAVGLGPAVPLVTQYSDHPITQDLNGYSYYPGSQPIGLQEVEGVTNYPLLFTNDTAQVQIVEEGTVQLDPNAPTQGTLSLGVAFSRPVESTDTPTDEENGDSSTDEETPPEARLVVIGNSAFATDGLFGQYLNGDVFLNSVSWLSQQNGAIAIRPKEPSNRRILLTGVQQALFSIIAILFVPLIAFAAAIGLWLKRR
jgi:ABC-type uncharacterized transport system involved in gliding motility auxiliary subunit